MAQAFSNRAPRGRKHDFKDAERLHEGVRFIEQGAEVGPREKKKRAQMLARALRKLGYEVTITPINQLAPNPAV